MATKVGVVALRVPRQGGRAAAPGRDRAHVAHVLRAARTRALLRDHRRVSRSSGLDRRDRRRALPSRGAMRRPIPPGQVGNRSPRRGPSACLEPGRPFGPNAGKGYRNRVATGDARRLKGARYVLWEEPRQPHQQAARQAGLDRQYRRAAALDHATRSSNRSNTKIRLLTRAAPGRPDDPRLPRGHHDQCCRFHQWTCCESDADQLARTRSARASIIFGGGCPGRLNVAGTRHGRLCLVACQLWRPTRARRVSTTSQLPNSIGTGNPIC
jgi:hypothetical protein